MQDGARLIGNTTVDGAGYANAKEHFARVRPIFEVALATRRSSSARRRSFRHRSRGGWQQLLYQQLSLLVLHGSGIDQVTPAHWVRCLPAARRLDDLNGLRCPTVRAA